MNDIAPVLVWNAPLVIGDYDIVDANRNGIYDASIDGLDGGSPGFVVIGIPPSASVPALADRDHRSDRLAVCCWRGQDQEKVQLATVRLPRLMRS